MGPLFSVLLQGTGGNLNLAAGFLSQVGHPWPLGDGREWEGF